MDTKKIGAFIAICRKEKGMTQAELGERLGVTNKTVSRWENGHYMPDLSLLEPLSKALDLSLEELLEGERLPEAPQAAAESRLQDVVDYSSQLLRKGRRWFCRIMLVLGALTVLLGLDGQGRTAALALALGWGMVALGAWQALRHRARAKQIIAVCALVVATVGSFLFVDYKMVTVEYMPPQLSLREASPTRPVVAYKTPLYTAYAVNGGTRNAYMVVDASHRYTIDTVPVSPFNRSVSGIEALLKYKSAYMGDNTNTGHLIGALPLAEDGFVFEMDPDRRALTVDYHRTAWYDNDDAYVQKALVYNSVVAFLLIENLDVVTANFSGDTVTTTRVQVEARYPDYEKLMKHGAVDTVAFDRLVEAKMNDYDFVNQVYPLLFESHQ